MTQPRSLGASSRIVLRMYQPLAMRNSVLRLTLMSSKPARYESITVGAEHRLELLAQYLINCLWLIVPIIGPIVDFHHQVIRPTPLVPEPRHAWRTIKKRAIPVGMALFTL